MRTRSLLLAFLVLVTATAEGAGRRRSVRVPARVDDSPAAWLATHAYTLNGTRLTSDRSDLEPLRTIVGDADVVGLGDGTHGTSEFYTVKLRMIDWLVRELRFDVISLELSFALADELNLYVQGGGGDPRAILREADRLAYTFWDSEELVEVIEWVRQYNAHRGSLPAVQIAGADIWDPRNSAEAVIEYLTAVDPSAIPTFQSDYECVLQVTSFIPTGCTAETPTAAYQRLEARGAELGTGSGAAAYQTALQNARVITQAFSFFDRDVNMAVNVRWLRQQRSETGRIIYWAHNEHVAQTPGEQTPQGSAGTFLEMELGLDYTSIATATGSGRYMTWLRGTGTTFDVPTIRDVPTPEAGTYEAYFQLDPRPAILIPLRGNIPAWLAGPARYFFGGTIVSEPPYFFGSLPEKHDAIVYIHRTSPITPLLPPPASLRSAVPRLVLR
jgi:erythromycin esterase